MSVSSDSPFPLLSVASLCVGITAYYVFYTSTLPYAPFMVVDFGVAKDLDHAGYTAGWISGIFMMGRLVSGIPFGVIADRWGRKPCLLISLGSIGILGIVFGLASSYTTALVARGLCGLNGFMTVLPTVVTEISSNKEQELRAFGYANAAHAFGWLVGPAIGGMLYYPNVKHFGWLGSLTLWKQYHFLFPSIVCSIIAGIAAVCIYFFVNETVHLGRPNEVMEMTLTAERKLYGSISTSERNQEEAKEEEEEPLPPDESKHYVLFLTCFQLSLCATMTKNALPLWWVSSMERGGLAWNSTDIVIVFTIVGMALVIFQIFFYPHIMKLFSQHQLLSVLLYEEVGCAIATCLLPISDLLIRNYSNAKLQFIMIIVLTSVHTILIVMCYSTLAVIINASVQPNRRGIMNGFTGTAHSLGNFIAPIVGSMLFAWLNEKSDHISFVDGRFIFVICSCLLLLLAVTTKHIPVRIT